MMVKGGICMDIFTGFDQTKEPSGGIMMQQPSWTHDDAATDMGMGTTAPQQLAYVAQQQSKQDESMKCDDVPSITVDSYYNLTRTLKGTGQQAHHLNQDAAFRSRIPRRKGLCIGLSGNAFRDKKSGHYMAHRSLESFWDRYRRGGRCYGQMPKLYRYNTALRKSLVAAGYSPKEAKYAVRMAQEQQEEYGLMPNDMVPRIPRRINQKR